MGDNIQGHGVGGFLWVVESWGNDSLYPQHKEFQYHDVLS